MVLKRVGEAARMPTRLRRGELKPALAVRTASAQALARPSHVDALPANYRTLRMLRAAIRRSDQDRKFRKAAPATTAKL